MDIKDIIGNNIKDAVTAAVKDLDARVDKSVEKLAKAAISEAVGEIRDELDNRVRELVAAGLSEAFGQSISVPSLPRKRSAKGGRTWSPEQRARHAATIAARKAQTQSDLPTPMPQAAIDTAEVESIDMDGPDPEA